MMRVLQFLLVVFFLASCRQDSTYDNTGTITFYKLSSTGSFSVYINNVYFGDVPYVDHTPICNSGEGLQLSLTAGTYSLDVRNNSNTTYVPPVQISLAQGDCKLYRAQ